MNRYSSYGQTDSQTGQDGDTGFIGVNDFDTLDSLQPGQVQFATNMDFTTQTAMTRGGFVCIPSLGNAPFAAGTNWTTHTSAADSYWRSIAYGNGRFVAVAILASGASDVMYSVDGVNWTAVSTGISGDWCSVCFGNGVFVAIAQSGSSGYRVMTSPNGITWTPRATPANIIWNGVCYGNGSYVAVASNGGTQQAMVSTNSTVWSISDTDATAQNQWTSVCYGNGLFVAVAATGTSNRVMTSPDGVVWTARASAADYNWYSVAYGAGKFVAVGNSGGTSSVMTSTDGLAWVTRTTPSSNWVSVAYGNAMFIAVGDSGSAATAVMTSPDGITWTAATAASGNSWQGVANGANSFVAVSSNGTGNRAMSYGATSTTYATGVYSDPNDAGSQWIMLLGYNSVGFYAFGRASRSVSLGFYTVSDQSTIVQCNNQVYIFRGSSAVPLYWDGDWAHSFTVVPNTTVPAFNSIANSNHAVYYQNRLWVKNGKDLVDASDVLDFTTYDPLANEFNVNTGSSDYLVCFYPFGENSLTVFKNRSIQLLQNVQGSLSDVTCTEVTRQLGCIGINAVCSVGPDLVYVSDRNINLLTLTSTNNSIQHKTQPLSRNIKTIIQRINWNYGYKISMGYWNNAVYIALPLDNATSCNAVVVYNFVTEQWYGEWNFDATIGMNILGWSVVNYLGLQRLHAVTEDGRIFVTGEGSNDISGTTVAEISTSLTTRAYRFDNNQHLTRRCFADLGTNRPKYSVASYTEGASESITLLTDQTYTRADSWIFNDSTYDLTNANNDYNRSYRKDYSSGPNSVQPGASGIQPEMVQFFRLPLITRQKGRLSWFQITNTQGLIQINGVGAEARAGDRGSFTQVV